MVLQFFRMGISLLLICVLTLGVLTALTVGGIAAWRALTPQASDEELPADTPVMATPDESSTLPPSSLAPAPQSTEKLTLKLCDGRLVVFAADQTVVSVPSFDPALLPAKERAALAEGISVSSWKELAQLLQDLTG